MVSMKDSVDIVIHQVIFSYVKSIFNKCRFFYFFEIGLDSFSINTF